MGRIHQTRGVVFRLGRALDAKGPGLVIIIPFVDRLTRVPMHTIVMDVPKQDVITRDNVSVAVNAVVHFRVLDPINAILQVQDFYDATAQLSQTTLRSVAGEAEMDDLLSERGQRAAHAPPGSWTVTAFVQGSGMRILVVPLHARLTA